MTATVDSVHLGRSHDFSKETVAAIELIEGIGVRGDSHAGVTVQHLSRVAADPRQPNLRQVHLLHRELFDVLADAGFTVAAGNLGENITTTGIDLLGLPVGSHLTIGTADIIITGLRNPCQQINNFSPGLLNQLIVKTESGEVTRLAGVMGVVARGGAVRPGDPIAVDLPPEPHFGLTRV